MSEASLSPLNEYKVYFVEKGDDDRERVIVARTDSISFRHDPNYGVIEDGHGTITRYLESETYTVELSLLPMEEGKFFRIENFAEEEEEE